MLNNEYLGRTTATAARAGFDEALRRHMLRVYNNMALGVAITGATALLVAATPAVHQVLFGTPVKWVVMFAPLAFVMLFSFKIERMSAAAARTTFLAFSAIMGLSLASVFLVYTGTSIARTFFIAAAMFGAMSLWGYTTKRDLSKAGGFLMMGLIGVVIASLVNVFLGSTMLQMIVSIVGVIVFTGLTAYDTQNIKLQFAESDGHESNSKMAVAGALSLYLSFVNIFQLLLNLTGERDG